MSTRWAAHLRMHEEVMSWGAVSAGPERAPQTNAKPISTLYPNTSFIFAPIFKNVFSPKFSKSFFP